jgi:hypothetical protein
MKEKILETSTSPKGLIVFCDRNLRYEGGLKAWLSFGPVILGAWILEAAITSHHGGSHRTLLLWFIFLAYLLIFPPAWKKALRFLRRKLVLDETQSSRDERDGQ